MTGGMKLGPGALVNAAKSPKMKLKRAGDDGDKRQFNYLIFGESETGKTSTAAQLAASGKKVLIIFTDLGDDNGVSGAQVYANLKKTQEAFKNNVAWVALNSVEDVGKFLSSPSTFVDGYDDFDADFLLWDGFSFHQQMNIIPDVEEDSNKDDSSEGAFETFRGWGIVKNRTIRTLSEFFGLRNASGKPLHKIVTAAVKYASEKVGPDKSEVKAQHQPDIQGAASKFIRYGFDVVFESLRSGEKFEYALNISSATKRRFTLPEKMEADFVKLHNNVSSQIAQ